MQNCCFYIQYDTLFYFKNKEKYDMLIRERQMCSQGDFTTSEQSYACRSPVYTFMLCYALLC